MISKIDENGIAFLFPGQGAQEPEMFKKLARSQNPNLQNSTEEVLETLKVLTDGSDIADTYYNTGVDPVKINSTENVQPGLAAYSAIFCHALENELGYRVVPDVASGYSFGVIPSLYALGVLSLEDMLNVAMMRGESMSLIKPGQFHVITIKTNEPVSVWRVNRGALRRTGYRISIRIYPDLISISGPARTLGRVEERLEKSGIINREIPVDDKKFYAPFHNRWEMEPYAALFRHVLNQYSQRRGEETGEPVFKDLTDRVFVTNGGKVLKDGDEIRGYISYPHIVQLCDFDKTMIRVGNLVSNAIGVGTVNLKRYAENGYIENHMTISASNLEEAARWYDSIIEKREQTPLRELIPAYDLS